MRAVSMNARYASATCCAVEPGFCGVFVTESMICCSAASLFSESSGNEPHDERSGGISVFLIQVPLTKRLKSSCGRTERSNVARSTPSVPGAWRAVNTAPQAAASNTSTGANGRRAESGQVGAWRTLCGRRGQDRPKRAEYHRAWQRRPELGRRL